ncbi:dihydropteroate synthase [Pseudoflavitalea sp. X16]|uniref:dihydropteroate synthase n=1 Tax=Paraflavitalea devenefica TaxID=2716334 RepID=UPI00141EE06C|nr:dihydropteroate synthase [Paraflavitalea devenefica]NII28782.1 dihydropteroate synthase [Paraflavitalea devenefica]
MYTLNCKGRLLAVDKPLVMGIMNTTPDSFYAGSRYAEADVLKQAERMINDGAAILDIGGQSTRPGSERISIEEELKRVTGSIRAIHQRFPEIILSIDTFQSRVAAEAVAAGASIVNDVSAGSIDDAMIPTVASLQVPYVLMHLKGTLETLKQEAMYENLVREVLDFFIQQVSLCRKAGIKDIILDPGFGFGKNTPQNLMLLKNLSVLDMLACPILVGLSRKTTIWKTLGITPDEALNGTTVLNTISLLNGAHILRVHDVKEAMETIKLWQAYRQA